MEVISQIQQSFEGLVFLMAGNTGVGAQDA